MDSEPLSEADLDAIEARANQASPGPWRALVEGRDHTSGDDFILLGPGQPDMYVSYSSSEGTRPASSGDLDFIAHARDDVERLVAELRRLRSDG